MVIIKTKILDILNRIGVSDTAIEELSDATLDKVELLKDKQEIYIYINNPKILTLITFNEIVDKFKKYFTPHKVFLSLSIKNIDFSLANDYYRDFINNKKHQSASLVLFLDRFNSDSFVIEVSNKIEMKKLEVILQELNSFFLSAGFDRRVSLLINEELHKQLKDEINKELEVTVPKIENKVKEETKVQYNYQKSDFPRRGKQVLEEGSILGRIINENSISIKSIVGEEDSLVVEAKIFGVDYFESSKSNFKIITLKLTDYTDSIYSKVFVRDDEEYGRLCKELKQGNWYRIRGYTKNDQFSKELVLNARDINKIEAKEEIIEDNEEVKRVELHAHTKMSQMDELSKLFLGDIRQLL